MKCPLCESLLVNRKDEIYFICDNCCAIVMDKSFYVTFEQEGRRYEEHNNNVDDVRYQMFTAPITNAVLNKFNKKHLGLDYGCGKGPVISQVLKQNGFQVILYDPHFYPDEDYLNHQYDYIFSCEVFEHFHNPKQEIEKLLSILKPEGFLFIMTHLYNSQIDFKNWYYRRDPTHKFIYTAETMNFISRIYNLTIDNQDNRMISLRKVLL